MIINSVINGDCTSVLTTIASECVDLVRTDPPYPVRYRDRLRRTIPNDIRRVVHDYELKRDYQRRLHEGGRDESRGVAAPARTDDEIHAWAEAQRLPVVQDRVQFPDVRIEYEHSDGRLDRQDLELATGHYNYRQMAAKGASGFHVQRSTASHLQGAGARRGGSPFDPGTAETVLQ
jgi:hypothetical protein